MESSHAVSTNLTQWGGYVRTGFLVLGVALIAIGISVYIKQQARHWMNIKYTPLLILGSISSAIGLVTWALIRRGIASDPAAGAGIATSAASSGAAAPIWPPEVLLELPEARGCAYDELFFDSIDLRGFVDTALGGHMTLILPGVFLGDAISARSIIQQTPTSSSVPNTCGHVEEVTVCASPGKQPVLKCGVRRVITIDTCEIRTPSRTSVKRLVFNNISDSTKVTYPAAMVEALPGIAQEIADSISKKEAILIHCGHGVSRSATALVFFLLSCFRINLNQALGLVQSKRPIIYPTTSFLICLKYFEEHRRLPNAQEFEEAVKFYAEDPIVKMGRTRGL